MKRAGLASLRLETFPPDKALGSGVLPAEKGTLSRATTIAINAGHWFSGGVECG